MKRARASKPGQRTLAGPVPLYRRGIEIGRLVGVASPGAPIVVFPGAPPDGIAGRTTVRVGPADVGREVTVAFVAGDPSRPIVTGLLESLDAPAAELDGQRLELTAAKEIVLRCGQASITLTRAGKVLIRGAHLVSRSTGTNCIKGGRVQIN
jgi:uncharacterized protein DUF6484